MNGCSFLAMYNLKAKLHITNISVVEDHNSDQFNDDTVFDSTSSSSGRGSHKLILRYLIMTGNKHLSSSDHEETIERLADVLKQPVIVNIPPIVPPPSMDKASLFGNLIDQLREVPPQFVDDIMIKVLQIISTVK
ncbi:uncharacterized protein [Mycetomoellerius zeteki]|uniref:uncharacterized protein n=1 Tax=Mycetomoellerius zeteki TaxID=64791 RepID=UPI00084EB386|nr:PREDICTED: uncharacterized protein LOC108725203 [Trachymyrmex zeteki]